MTSPGTNAQGDCPSWEKMARFVVEGGPWPAEHLRACARCNDRRRFLESLAMDGLSDQRATPAEGSCPDILEVIAVVEGSVSTRERLRIVGHFSECDACSALFKELVALTDAGDLDWELRDGLAEQAEVGRAEPYVALITRHPFARRIAAALVLALALVAVFAVPFPEIETGIGDRWRGPAASLDATISWPEGEIFPTVRADAVDGVDSFRVRVWNEQGVQLFERHRTAAEPLTVTLELRRIDPDDTVFWQVEALEMGEVVSTSGPQSLTWARR